VARAARDGELAGRRQGRVRRGNRRGRPSAPGYVTLSPDPPSSFRDHCPGPPRGPTRRGALRTISTKQTRTESGSEVPDSLVPCEDYQVRETTGKGKASQRTAAGRQRRGRRHGRPTLAPDVHCAGAGRAPPRTHAARRPGPRTHGTAGAGTRCCARCRRTPRLAHSPPRGGPRRGACRAACRIHGAVGRGSER